MSDWQDRIVGARMTVDEQFTPQLRNSPFSRQEWGMIMTAVEFDIRDADDEDAASLVADTDKLPAILPELEAIRDHQSTMGAGGGGGRGGGGGIIESVTDALGLGGGSDDPDPETVAAAENLAGDYAEQLQTHLEETGRWGDVRAAYLEE